MKKILQNKTTRTNLTTYALVTVAFLVLQTLSSMGMLKSSVNGYLVPVCVYIVLTISLNLLVGVCGELSLGHAGFMGIGAFSGIVAAALLQSAVPNGTLRLITAMIVGGVLAGFLGFLIGIPVLRLRGDYLAIVTLAFGEILKNLIGNMYIGTDAKGLHFSISASKMELLEGGTYLIAGPKGATGVEKLSTFSMGFVLILFTLFIVLNLINSKEGRAIKAIKENRIAAESVGINVTAVRMKAFVVSAFLAGMAGALFGLNFSSVTASKFNFNTSINILVFVVLGGMGNMLGSILAAALLTVLPELLRSLNDYRMLIYAIVLILMMLFNSAPAMIQWREQMTEKLRKTFGEERKEG